MSTSHQYPHPFFSIRYQYHLSAGILLSLEQTSSLNPNKMKTIVLAFMLALVAAAPAPKPDNFEASHLLDIGKVEESSYATKREVFESDPLLQIGKKTESSYVE